MLVFVDYEHEDGHAGEHGERMLAARTRITYRLEDLAGRRCHLVRYDRIDADLLEAIDATAIFISGNSKDPDHYEVERLEPVMAILREAALPVFGFCGGFQLLALALGADVVPIRRRSGSDDDPTVVTLPDGRPFEFGFHPIDIDPGAVDHPLLRGLGDRPVVRHAHGLEVPTPPAGFVVMASTPTTTVQLAVHEGRRIVGTQFHPEYWTDEHPAGRTLIANFLRWAGVAHDR